MILVLVPITIVENELGGRYVMVWLDTKKIYVTTLLLKVHLVNVNLV
jgi:hypothetical protein